MAVALAAVLGGCRAGAPVAAPEVAIPDDWSAAPGAPAAVDPAWWRDFGGAPLGELLDEALAHNHDLTAAAARLWAARARAVIAGADDDVQLSARLGRTRAKNIYIGLPIPGSGTLATRSTRHDGALDLSWELDLWGRLAAAEDAAHADTRAALADLAGARLSVAGRTVQAWLALIEARGQLALAEQDSESWRASRALVERRYRAGLAPAVDLRLLRASEAAADAGAVERGLQLERAARALELLLGRYPAAEIAADDAGLSDLHALPPPGLPATLLARRPDLAAAEARLLAASRRTDAARAALYPRLALTGSVGTTSSEARDLLDGDFTVWSLLGQLVQPIFQGGRLRAAVDLADAEARGAAADFANALLDAFAEVEDALSAERRLSDEQSALARAAVEARAAADLAARAYAAGTGDLLTMFETERGAQAADRSLLAVRRARLAARVDLYLALGGGFDRDLDRGAPDGPGPASVAVLAGSRGGDAP